MTNNSDEKNEDQNPMKDYNPADRDFQRTEDEIDDVSKSEKEELERRKHAFMRRVQGQTRIMLDDPKSKGHSTL